MKSFDIKNHEICASRTSRNRLQPFTLLYFKVALHTSQQFALHKSGYYFKDCPSQNSFAITYIVSLILSSLDKPLESHYKRACSSPLPQKNLFRSFLILNIVYLATLQLVGSLACVVICMGLWGYTVIFAQGCWVDILCI